MSQEVANTLRTALSVLVKGGWCKGVYADTDGAHCAVGAVMVADPRREHLRDSIWALRHATGFSIEVTEWNDDPDRTFFDVLAAFKTAIKEEEKS
jgi:hypothetical protein